MEKRNHNLPIVYVFVFDSYSDWEPAYATAELHKSGRFTVKTFGIDEQPVISAGGLIVLPNTTMQDEALYEAAMIIIPGGEAINEGKVNAVLPVLERAWKSNIPVATICAATTLLANMGILDDIPHTGNALPYVQHVAPWYKGSAYYTNEPAVTSGHVITAGGVYPVEFAREIFAKLGLYDDVMLERWYQLFKNGVWADEF